VGILVDVHQLLLGDQDAAGLQLRGETRVGFLRHHHQDVGLSDVGVENRLGGENHLRAGGAAAGFRSESLRHGGVAAFENRGGFADDGGGEDHALAAESGDSNFTERLLHYDLRSFAA
jgi:hypothetical protein